MDGYSVTEAASVLGVPTERVWELLARGVLSGAPEGETGMRVYLQPRPVRAPLEPTGPNGDGGTREPERELSPFRELLTEFRNLTERYGQALLALGEARGEVASLRSRVDLLEARMDLRLPAGSPQAATWSSPPAPAPLERPVVPVVAPDAVIQDREGAAVAPSERVEPAEDDGRPARARGPRRATESFAEALARAEDPSPPELPGGAEAAAALAALRHHPEAPLDVGLPREVAGADAIPVAEADEEGPFEITPDRVETGAIAAAPEPADAMVEPAEALPEPMADEAITDEPMQAGREPMADAPHPTFAPREEPVPLARPVEVEPGEAAIEPVTGEPAAALETIEPVTGEPLPTDVEDEPAPEPVEAATDDAVEPITWDTERYTTDIEEPDWLAAEVLDAPQASADPAPPDAMAAEGEPTSAGSEGPAAPTADDGPGLESGADEMEVAAMGAPAAAADAPAGPARPFPGARDLEDAIAALRAAGMASEPPEPEPELESRLAPGTPHARASEEPDAEAWPPRSASRAYRRLRRIFPS